VAVFKKKNLFEHTTPTRKAWLFQQQKVSWNKSYVVVLESGEVYEMDYGFDAVYICNVADLLYPKDLEAKRRMITPNATKHFIDYYSSVFGELLFGEYFGTLIDNTDNVGIGVLTFVERMITHPTA